jgi:hypothetical protein
MAMQRRLFAYPGFIACFAMAARHAALPHWGFELFFKLSDKTIDSCPYRDNMQSLKRTQQDTDP